MCNVPARLVGFVIALAFLLPVALIPSQVSAEVNGSTWTSAAYGCVVSWSPQWFFLEELTEEGYDYLALSDGSAYAEFVCGSAQGFTPQQELTGTILAWCSGEGTSNCQPVLDGNGNSQRVVTETHATDTYSFTQMYEDGSSADLVVRFDIQTVASGVSLLTLLTVEESLYPGSVQAWNDLLLGVQTSVVDETEGGFTDASTTPEPVAVSGDEPAPVVAVDNWRFAIASATIGSAIPGLELEAKDGREWVVIVADVSNWSDIDGTFGLRDPLVQSDQMAEAWDIAPASTRQVARVLQLTTQGNESVDILAGETARIVLVYSVPAGGTNTWLLMGDTGLELDDHIDLAFDPASLPPLPTLPSTSEDTLTNVSVNSAGAVTVGLSGTAEEYVLIGTDIPSGSECFGNEAIAYLLQYIGSAVVIERDPAVEGTSAIYLWVVQPDGNNRLLNQELLAEGIARISSLPDEARFGSWMSSSEQTAQLNGDGLWTLCGS